MAKNRKSQGTNHIYASGDRSVIDKNVGDRKGRPGDPLPSNPSFTGDRDTSSANKYYANLKGKGPDVNVMAPSGGSRLVDPLVLDKGGDFGGILDQATSLVRDGYRLVPVQILDAQLERQFNAQLDMLVARERLLPEQRAAIKVGRPVALANVADAGLTAEEVKEKVSDNTPTQQAEAMGDDGLDDLDMDAFVAGDIPEEALDGQAPKSPIDEDAASRIQENLAAEEDDGDDDDLSELDETPGS